MDKEELKKLFESAYDEHVDAVFRRCLFKVSDRETAKDITQESFVRLWSYMEKGEDEVDNAKALVFRIANNLIIDTYRKKKSESLDNLQDQGFDPAGIGEERVIDSTDKSYALQVISKLPEMYRQVVMLRYVEELTPQEISEIIDESENVVSVRIHRGLKKIKEILDKLDKTDDKNGS